MLTALPIPLAPNVLGTLTGLALSPGGLKLAVAWDRPRRASTGAEIQVFNLVTGAVKTWTWPGGQPVVIRIPGAAQVLSWAADGTLAFQQRTESSAQVRLLDTNDPGGSLQADSLLALAWTGTDLPDRPNNVTGVNVLLTPPRIQARHRDRHDHQASADRGHVVHGVLHAHRAGGASAGHLDAAQPVAGS